MKVKENIWVIIGIYIDLFCVKFLKQRLSPNRTELVGEAKIWNS